MKGSCDVDLAIAPVASTFHRRDIMITILCWHYYTFVMYTDYPGGASMQQPQSSHTFQPRLDEPLTFSKDMNYEQLAQWLRNLTGTDYEEDISKLSGTCCTL